MASYLDARNRARRDAPERGVAAATSCRPNLAAAASAVVVPRRRRQREGSTRCDCRTRPNDSTDNWVPSVFEPPDPTQQSRASHHPAREVVGSEASTQCLLVPHKVLLHSSEVAVYRHPPSDEAMCSCGGYRLTHDGGDSQNTDDKAIPKRYTRHRRTEPELRLNGATAWTSCLMGLMELERPRMCASNHQH
jgi:hypothetical protein